MNPSINNSGAARGRRALYVWLLAALAPVVFLLCAFAGAAPLAFGEWSTPQGQAILSLRLSRIICGFMAGAGLACSGVVLQALLRNPLADPYVLGVSSGAALGAAAAIMAGAAGIYLLPLCAFAGAAAVLALVLLLARQGGVTNVYSLLLSGIIVGSICTSILMLLISIAPVEGLHSITWWMLGNLQVTSLALLAFASALITAGFAGIWLMARKLNALTLGREMAHYLGVRSGPAILWAVVLATISTAAAVAMTGLIGFVGLIIPHLARLVFGPDHRVLVPASALAGGLFLVICDTFARTIMAPVEIPVGVITALIGGPFFLFLLRRRPGGWFS